MKATALVIVAGLIIFGGILPIAAQDNDTGTKTPKADGKPTGMPAESRRLDVVLDLQRPSNTDILLLRNGDKLTGTILNDSFSIRSSYARMKFVNRVIAGVDLAGGANNIESIITVNNNRFSGFIDDPVFAFKPQSGTQIKIRREKVLKAVFRVRKSERRGIPQNQFVVLKNGDYFSGTVLNDKITVATAYAKVPVQLAEVNTIRLIGGPTPLAKIMMLNNDSVQGVLETEDVEVKLDVGPTVKVYKDRVDVVYCRKGFVPGLADLQKRVRSIKLGENILVGYYGVSHHMGFRLTKIIKGSPAERAGLRTGDIVHSVDGVKMSDDGAVFIKHRNEIIQGKRNHANIVIFRGKEWLTYRLVK